VTERPRDRLGRPLAWDAEGFPGVEQRTEVSWEVAVSEAHDYLGRDLPFHAHEILEIRWRCCPEDERALWRGLAQAAAGHTQAARGNEIGAQRLVLRGRETIEAYAGSLDESTRQLIAILTEIDPATEQ
jgi:hypothetical protein